MKPNKNQIKMRARTRKEKEVWEACAALDGKNEKLTYMGIGEQLIHMGYKRGSNSDIRRYLSTWKRYHTSSSKSVSAFFNEDPALLEHEPLQTNLDIGLQNSWDWDKQLLALAQHYATQFDRLLKVNELFRKENVLLRKKLKETLEKAAIRAKKPRIIVRADVEEV